MMRFRGESVLREVASGITGSAPGDAPVRVLVVCDTADVESAGEIVREVVLAAPGNGGDVVVVDIGPSAEGPAADAALADATPMAHDDDRTPHAAYLAAVEWGPFDVVIDYSQQPSAIRRAVFANAYFRLRPGGRYHYLVGPGDPTGPGTVPGDVDDAASRGRRLVAAVRRATLPRLELSRAVASIARGPSSIVVTKAEDHLPKLRDTTANALLAAARPERLRVLDTVEPMRHESSATATMYGATRPPAGFETVHDVPRLWLREYRDVTVLPGQVVVLDELVLPDTFRHNRAARLRTTTLVDSAHHYARFRGSAEPVDRLDGTYYYLDSEFGGRYGHLLTEQVGRLWGWDRAVVAHPDLRVLLSSDDPHARLERQVLAAFGIPDDRVTVLTAPARVERLVAASPMFQNPRYASSALLPVWARIRDGLRSGRRDSTEPASRLFVTRRGWGNRTCRNAAEVETFFAGHGFAVLDPAALSLREQAQLFATADVVAGFGGSALINGIFSEPPTRRIVISHEAYTARNEHLIACLFGDEQHYFWSRPEVDQPARGWSVEAFQSAFTFDLAAAEDRLREILG